MRCSDDAIGKDADSPARGETDAEEAIGASDEEEAAGVDASPIVPDAGSSGRARGAGALGGTLARTLVMAAATASEMDSAVNVGGATDDDGIGAENAEVYVADVR